MEKPAATPKPAPTPSILTFAELETKETTTIHRLFGPILHPTVTLIHAPAGAGKSMLVHEIALAVASGKSAFTAEFPGWRIEEPYPVLLVDGELPLAELRRRLGSLRQGRERDGLHILSNAQRWQDGEEMIDRASKNGRALIEAAIEQTGAKAVILDNLATLTNQFYDEDGAGAQRPINTWQAGLRESGVSVILVHHDNKSGKQRGSSDRETICDLIVSLQRLAESRINQASFTVGFDKARFLASEPVEFTATLNHDGWSFGSAESGLMQQFLAHMAEVEEFNYRDVMFDLRVSKPTTYRLVREAREAGLWRSEWKGPRRRRRAVKVVGLAARQRAARR